MDPWSAVADEVALEGLDGITIPTLWIRLEDRLPRFPLKFDDCTKELIWRSLISNTDLKFYELPEERGDVVLSDRFKDTDPEAGTETAQKFPERKKDVYPVHIILENKDGIQGSCAFFIDRIDITKHVRSKSLTALVKLEEALERYGRKLVVVASQSLRFRTLIGSESDPDLKLNDDSYCVLERVGRARWQGELQSDLHGSSFKTDARKLHYMRKSLVKHGLISMQSHVTRVKSGQQQHSILLLLKRFHINRRSKYDILMEYVSNVLQQLPGQFATLITFKEQLNMSDSTFKRVCQYMRTSKLVEFCQYPLEDLDPSAGPCTTKKGNKVLVRCLRLLKPYSRKGVTDDDDDDEDEEDDSGARRGAFPQEARIMEKDVLTQAYHIVLSSGTKGIPKTGIGYRMNVGKLESRMLCRRLERDGLIKGFMEDEGRQRTTKFISHKCVSINENIFLNSYFNTSLYQILYNGSIHLLQTRSPKKPKKSLERSHETYRLLKRKNLIVEAVRNFKIIEGLFPLQKMINDEEKQDGVSSKCCKKTILRLVHGLSREGLLKIYTTTVIQDGITKKVEMVVHPSIQPNDDIVHRVIEQVRFKISNFSSSSNYVSLIHCFVLGLLPLSGFIVRGLGKTFGFQPKMHRLRVVHNFLWYLMYGHPLRHNSTSSDSTGETPSFLSTRFGFTVIFCLSLIVYTDEESWKKFIPPVRAHKEFSGGWAMVGDLLLCLPLSIFIQVIQINYKVDGLEEYLNDPVKQHHLVRSLPARMRRQLLYKRKYLFSFHENLQKLVYMGLLQFGPLEKFKEKDQVFVYLRRHTTIVDTTNAEPHYWLVTELADKPFERRQYTFNTHEDVENYWFDLMCVCLNTPLGVIRSKRNVTDDDSAPSFVQDRSVFVGMGSREVCDDGSLPGDGKGAGGLDSEFFAHLKRNWLWTNHLLSVKSVNNTKHRFCLPLQMRTKSRGFKQCFSCLCLRNQVDIEPASRNQRVVGGKKQKRKRSKKEVVKVPRKKKKGPKKRTPAHDEADHRALKMMTRQRVYWSVQEDSLMMLCSVASHLLNSKLKRPFIPHCGVRDLLHTEFEMSMDKTSVAVGRRSRYILKNPQTLLNYRICLAEVYQDKSLMKLLEEKKPGDPDKPEDCAEAFSEYARLLRQKFSAVMSARDMTMPDTKKQLFSRFKVSTIDNGKWVSNKDTLNSTDDIHAIVLHNLIQSTLAMTNCQMKSSRSFQTFHMYSRYNQELLCQVFIQCRKRGLVNRRRVNQPFGPKKNRALPILPMSYQLSQSYYRCFSWRFPHSLCTDSFRFLRNIINNGTRDDRPLTDPPDVSDMLQFSLDSPGGACVISLSLMSLGLLSVYVSIPKQMVVVDSNLVDNDVLRVFSLEEEDDDDYDGEECEGRKKLEVKAHQASHTNYLMMRGYCCPGIVKLRNLNTNDNIVVESCIMKLQLRSTPAHNMFTMENSPPLDLTKCGPSLLPSILTYTVCSPSSSSSHSVEECDRLLIQQRGYTPQDIEAWAQLRRSLAEAGQNGLDVHDLYQAHTHLEEPQSGRTRSLQQYMKDLQEEGQVVKAGGLGVRWVLTQHAEPWLLTVNTKQWSQSRFTSDKLPFLENEHHIPFMRKRPRLEGQHMAEEPPAKKPAVDRQEIQTVIPIILLQLTVHFPFLYLNSFFFLSPSLSSSTSHSENVSFISRPWRMVDGTLNRQVCKGMLEATLYHIMSRPGLTQQTLVEHYKDVLQPMAVLDLMQALIDMGCVTKKTLVKGPKPSLFTRSVHQTRRETDVKIEEPDTVFYEPTISCCLRLSQVLPNERHWNYCIP
uniref:Ral transcription factor IIIC subunit 1 n=1 Tax=Seriola dumerili TaxID=41447 RepID=A0A3B4UME3_SERDU